MSETQENPRQIIPTRKESMTELDQPPGAKEKVKKLTQFLQEDGVKNVAETKASLQQLTQALDLMQRGAELKNLEAAFELLFDIESTDAAISSQIHQVRGLNLLVLAAMHKQQNSDTSLACYSALMQCCDDAAIRGRAFDEIANIYEERKDPSLVRIIEVNRNSAKKSRNGAEDTLGNVDAARLLRTVQTLQENVRNERGRSTLHFKKTTAPKKPLAD